MDNSDLVKAYLAAVERFDVPAVAALLDPSMVQREMPNLLYAEGQSRDRARMLEDLPKGARLLRDQRYEIQSLTADGDRVVVEARWEGTLSVPLGRLQAGDSMVAHIPMVFECRDGRIVGQRNYDCYEPFR